MINTITDDQNNILSHEKDYPTKSELLNDLSESRLSKCKKIELNDLGTIHYTGPVENFLIGFTSEGHQIRLFKDGFYIGERYFDNTPGRMTFEKFNEYYAEILKDALKKSQFLHVISDSGTPGVAIEHLPSHMIRGSSATSEACYVDTKDFFKMIDEILLRKTERISAIESGKLIGKELFDDGWSRIVSKTITPDILNIKLMPDEEIKLFYGLKTPIIKGVDADNVYLLSSSLTTIKDKKSGYHGDSKRSESRILILTVPKFGSFRDIKNIEVFETADDAENHLKEILG